MILEKQKEVQLLEDGVAESSIAMSLDLDSAQILMQMLSKNLYSDAIGSTIRETASNALDSHRKAGVTDPIIVTYGVNSSGNYEFSVEDFGIGLDDHDVETIISKYGKSTKRQDANQLGMMGLGFKSPLAYSSSFYFVARKDGTERKYMMYEGEDVNTIDLMYESPTTERNGVKVIVPVKYQDRSTFITKMKEQLAYFESVYFKVDTVFGSIRNDFIIHRTPHFQVSSLASSRELHMCLDNVYYPLDFAKLGIGVINVPVALRFSLSDGIFPTPNRESVRYTQETIRTIKSKISLVAEDLVKLYNEGVKETDSLEVLEDYYNNNNRYVSIGNVKINIHELLLMSKSKIAQPTLKGIVRLNSPEIHRLYPNLLSEYRIKYMISKGKMSEYADFTPFTLTGENRYRKFFIYNERIGGNKREYLKTLVPYDQTVYVLKKTVTNKLRAHKGKILDTDNYMGILGLKHRSKTIWREIIKEYQYLQSFFTSKFTDIDSLVIPQSWLDARKRKRMLIGGSKKAPKLQGEIYARVGEKLEKYLQGRYCKFVPTTLPLDTMYKQPFLTVYDRHDNSEGVDQLWGASRAPGAKIRVMTLSDREIRLLEKVEIHNVMSYKQFMKGETKAFKRIITAYLINQLIKKFPHAFSRMYKLEPISKSLHEKMETLQKYSEKNFTYGDNKIYEAMLKVARANYLYDMTIYDMYQEVYSTLSRMKFIEVILRMSSNSYNNTTDKEIHRLLTDLFRQYNYRMDPENYAISRAEEALDLEALLLTSDVSVTSDGEFEEEEDDEL